MSSSGKKSDSNPGSGPLSAPGETEPRKAAPHLTVISPGSVLTPAPDRMAGIVSFFRSLMMLLMIVAVGLIAYPSAQEAIHEYFNFETTDDAQLSAHIALLSTKVGGVVTEVKYDDNSRVKAGDTLVVLDSREYDYALLQQQAELTAQEARFWEASIELDRIKVLSKGGAVSQKALDSAMASYNENAAKISALKALISQARLNLEYTKIKAPTDGVMGKRHIEPGMAVRPMQAVSVLVDLSRVWVVANFKETQLKHIQPGQEAQIQIDAIQGKIFVGRVESFAAASGASFALIPPDNATGNFTKIVQRVPIRIALLPESIRGYEDRLVPGINVFVKIAIPQANAANKSP